MGINQAKGCCIQKNDLSVYRSGGFTCFRVCSQLTIRIYALPTEVCPQANDKAMGLDEIQAKWCKKWRGFVEHNRTQQREREREIIML